ncbi:MAG: MFS transporter [Planctomycetota bacterium]
MLFALPFVLLGPLTGTLADRVSKTSIIRAANAIEIGVMGLALIAFFAHSYEGLLLTLFLMGAQSALFGPAKYGIIKELVGESDLAGGNSIIQSFTMLAILGGTVAGGMLAQYSGANLWQAGIVYVVLAAAGWFLSLKVRLTPAYDPAREWNWNPVRSLFGHWRNTGRDRVLKLAVVSSSFYYMVASLLVQIVLAYGTWLGLSESGTAKLPALSAAGVILGSWTAGRICGDHVVGKLIPAGLLVFAASAGFVLLQPHSVWFLGLSLLGMGVGSGWFTVPIRCLIQGRPKETQRGSIQGLAEVMDFIGILLAGAVFLLLDKGLHLTPPQMFAVAGGLVGSYSLLTLPMGKVHSPMRTAEERAGEVETEG